MHGDHPTGLEPQRLGQEDRGQDNSSRKASQAMMPLARSASTIGRCQLDDPLCGGGDGVGEVFTSGGTGALSASTVLLPWSRASPLARDQRCRLGIDSELRPASNQVP